jgi:acetyl esterase
MKTNFFNYLRFLIVLVRIKLLNIRLPKAGTSGTMHFPPLPAGVLDEQTALLRKGQALLGEIPLDQTTPAQARLDFNRNFPLLKSIGGTFEKVGSTREMTIPGVTGGIPARLYLPDIGARDLLFVLLHGGGWVIGDLESADNMARFLCKHLPCGVLSVDYRLAPEHPFPAAVEDSDTAVQWAVTHAGELGFDHQRVLVGGDSAGGTLTAVVSQLARKKGVPRIAGQVMFYPATNAARLDTPSYQEFGERSLGLPRRDMEWFLDQYAPNLQNRLDPRISPLLADDLHGLPPALVVTAEFDVLRDEGEAYARHLERAGVKAKLMRCNGMIHGFLSLIGLIRWANLYFEQIIDEVRKMVSA